MQGLDGEWDSVCDGCNLVAAGQARPPVGLREPDKGKVVNCMAPGRLFMSVWARFFLHVFSSGSKIERNVIPIGVFFWGNFQLPIGSQFRY